MATAGADRPVEHISMSRKRCIVSPTPGNSYADSKVLVNVLIYPMIQHTDKSRPRWMRLAVGHSTLYRNLSRMPSDYIHGREEDNLWR